MGNRSLLENDVHSTYHPDLRLGDVRDERCDGLDHTGFSPIEPGKPAGESANINARGFGPIIGKSKAIQKVFEAIARTAPSKASVVIYGDSGTGKELVSQTIHNLSPRRNNAFVPVNCGAIPFELIESEFFGYKKGAFTGAYVDKDGFIDRADGGTLFLDEVGELAPAMQVKLLRAIDGGGFSPIGSQVVKHTDFRIIAATNRDLREEVRNGQMREDFYYRINILPIYMPNLRERKEDIPLLVNHFLTKFSQDQVISIMPAKLMELLESHDWPGNIRELQNIIQRYVTMKEIGFLDVAADKPEASEHPLTEIQCELDLKSALEYFEKDYIAHSLKAMNWHQGKTCAALNINRKTLYKKIRKYGLKKKYCAKRSAARNGR